MQFDFVANAVEIGEVAHHFATYFLGQLLHGAGEVAHHLALRKIHLVYFGGTVIHMDYFLATMGHEKRRLFNHIVAHIDNEVGTFNGTVQIIAV